MRHILGGAAARDGGALPDVWMEDENEEDEAMNPEQQAVLFALLQQQLDDRQQLNHQPQPDHPEGREERRPAAAPMPWGVPPQRTGGNIDYRAPLLQLFWQTLLPWYHM